MSNTKQIKFSSVKFRLKRSGYKRGRIIDAADIEDLGYQLNDDFNVWDWVDVYFMNKRIGVMEGSWAPVFWWLMDPAELSPKIVNFFDPTGHWSRCYAAATKQRWSETQLDIIGEVE